MIPFNKPYLTGKELHYISEAHARGQLAGDGYFTKKCNAWLEEKTGCHKALLTHSCTAALEMAAILADIQPGDEVIMPSYTFVSTANAFVLRGGVPVFVDIREDTLNIDERLIEPAITPRTKAIVPVHYAGVACEMDTIMAIARNHNLLVIEDAAQGVMATYKGRPLGSIGDLGCYSFHETKNIISGEGGVLLINNPVFADRAEIIREKGTNRSQFFRGQVDKYTWVDIGSSWIPSDMLAAILAGQLSRFESISAARLRIFDRYAAELAGWGSQHGVRLPVIPEGNEHTAHLFSLRFDRGEQRDRFIAHMKEHGISAVFHYQPLHLSTVGRQFGGREGQCPVTEKAGDCLVRLPLFVSLSDAQQDEVVARALEFQP